MNCNIDICCICEWTLDEYKQRIWQQSILVLCSSTVKEPAVSSDSITYRSQCHSRSCTYEYNVDTQTYKILSFSNTWGITCINVNEKTE